MTCSLVVGFGMSVFCQSLAELGLRVWDSGWGLRGQVSYGFGIGCSRHGLAMQMLDFGCWMRIAPFGRRHVSAVLTPLRAPLRASGLELGLDLGMRGCTLDIHVESSLRYVKL